MANFLVDFGMAGLKDAFGRLDITEPEFLDQVLEPFQDRFPMASVQPAEAGKYIAGAIRFAHDNGFRLPHRYDRWLAILGDIGDWRNADVSDFEMQFAGSLDDLRHRLVGQSVDEFIQRKDVSILLSDSAPSLLSDDIVDYERADEELRRRAVSSIRQWLMASNRQPSRMLETAWDIYAEATATAADDVSDDDGSVVEAAYQMDATIQDLIALEPSADRADLGTGVAQIVEYATHNQDSLAKLLSAEDDD
jgi:hypothetical protein